MPSKTRLANKTIWALEDIKGMCLELGRALDRVHERAAELGDPLLLAPLYDCRREAANIERVACAARNGHYEEQ